MSWVLDADIRGFFDTIDHEWLLRFVEHRIGDPRLLQLIRKWLSAGVLENGKRSATTIGTPQGATVSPLLANVYLHDVFDLWADRWRKTQARGDVIIVRFADDVVVGFQPRAEAERFGQELRERLAEFGLELHRDKTRLIEFGRFAARDRRLRGLGKPETFDFLGFTHICGTTRRGKFLLVRHTVRKRMRAKLKEVKPSSCVAGIYPSLFKGSGWQASFKATPTTTLYRRTSSPLRRSVWKRSGSGIGRCRAAARRVAFRGSAWRATATAGSHPPEFSILGLRRALTSEPEAGAQCVSSARWDLRGGRPEPH